VFLQAKTIDFSLEVYLLYYQITRCQIFHREISAVFGADKYNKDTDMATLAEQANLYNEAIAQGLSQQEAIDTAGIQDFDQFVFVDGLLTARVPASAFVIGPEEVEDTGGVPTQSLADIDGDTGFVPQPQLSAAADPQAGGFVFGPDGELIPADSAEAQIILAQEQRVTNTAPEAVGGNFVARSNQDGTGPGDVGTWYVENADTGEIVAVNLTQQEAILQAEEFSVGDPQYLQSPEAQGPIRSQADIRAADFAANQANAEATKERARQQATLQNQQKQAAEGDWRVKLRLAPGANYLYRANDGQGTQAGIMQPLAVTDGVVFPYTPQITTAYRARYSEFDLTHSNYRGYFYQGSHIDEINLTATFTAQDTFEANYLLAVITFFKSITKMFYGQDGDALRGAPPPLVFLQGLGQYQFSRNPCVVSSFNYNLPADVDYIRADVQPITGLNIQQDRRDRQNLPTNVFTSALGRLRNAGLPKGGINIPPAPAILGTASPTYVPTKMDMTVVLLPMQTRQQVSNQFSLEKYANGNLIKGGFW